MCIRDRFYREPTTVEGAAPRCPDEDWEASKRVDEYMREHGGGEVYTAYSKISSNIIVQLAKEWIAQHGLACDDCLLYTSCGRRHW